MDTYHAAVREVAAALTPSPSIDTQFVPHREKLGQLAHSDFVERRPTGLAERTIQYTYTALSERKLILNGRIDLLHVADCVLRIYEFKTVILSPGEFVREDFVPPERMQLQLQIYAYMLSRGALRNDIQPYSTMESSLVIQNLADNSERTWKVPLDHETVQKKLDEFINIMDHQYAVRHASNHRRRSVSVNLCWPFPEYRAAQEEIIEQLLESFAVEKNVIFEAPSGFGKTMTIVFSALKQALSHGRQVYFATAKGGGRDPIRKTLEVLQQENPDIKALFLSAQDHLCPEDVLSCKYGRCGYNRIEEDEYSYASLPGELLKHNLLTLDKFRDIGHKFNICPVDLSYAMVSRVDFVVGDYNYVFDPHARLRQFRQPGVSDWILLVDEAHNLVTRGQDIFSEHLSRGEVEACLQLLQDEQWRYTGDSEFDCLSSTVSGLKDFIDSLFGDNLSGLTLPAESQESTWFNVFSEFEDKIVRFLLSNANRLDEELTDSLLQLYFKLFWLCELLNEDQERFLFYLDGDRNRLGIKCIDAAEKLEQTFAIFQSIGAFSATLKPYNFYRTALGLSNCPVACINAESAFDSSRQLVCLAGGIDTRLKARPHEAQAIAEVLLDLCSIKAGSYMAVFPSYEFINLVKPFIVNEGINIIAQQRDMDPASRDRFLHEMNKSGGTTLALVVAGGQFSEAADYPGDACIGVAIIGPCLPPPDPWREAEQMYWHRQGEDGEKIAYLIPAVQRIRQAAGRLIRSADDRGVVLLLDDRFRESRFLDLLPASWKQGIQNSYHDWKHSVDCFWQDPH